MGKRFGLPSSMGYSSTCTPGPTVPVSERTHRTQRRELQQRCSPILTSSFVCEDVNQHSMSLALTARTTWPALGLLGRIGALLREQTAAKCPIYKKFWQLSSWKLEVPTGAFNLTAKKADESSGECGTHTHSGSSDDWRPAVGYTWNSICR